MEWYCFCLSEPGGMNKYVCTTRPMQRLRIFRNFLKIYQEGTRPFHEEK